MRMPQKLAILNVTVYVRISALGYRTAYTIDSSRHWASTIIGRKSSKCFIHNIWKGKVQPNSYDSPKNANVSRSYTNRRTDNPKIKHELRDRADYTRWIRSTSNVRIAPHSPFNEENGIIYLKRWLYTTSNAIPGSQISDEIPLRKTIPFTVQEINNRRLTAGVQLMYNKPLLSWGTKYYRYIVSRHRITCMQQQQHQHAYKKKQVEYEKKGETLPLNLIEYTLAST